MRLLSIVGAVADDGPQQSVETVVVTGSRIPQTGLTSVSPVNVVSGQETNFEGTTHIENLLNNLPSVTADQGENQSNGATGIATVNLRDLGSNRTLVLIDGRRLMPGDPTTPVADLNQIPAALVDHVEVLTGGASAVYGSDALAGAVNFILRKDFDGLEADGSYTIAAHDNNNPVAQAALHAAAYPVSIPRDTVWDGGNADASMLWGVTSENGRGNIVAYAGYRNTQALLETQRDYTACAIDSAYLFGFAPSGFICLGSSASPAVGFLQSADGQTGRYRTTQGGDLLPFQEPRDDYNFAPFNYLQRPDTRWTAGAFGHYEISKTADFYTSIMFMDDNSVAQIAPSGWFRAGAASLNGAMAVNCDNPFLGSASDPDSPESIFCVDQGLGPQDDAQLIIGRRLTEAGNRQSDLRHTSYRLVSGLRGDLGKGWSYEIYGQYGRTASQQANLNDASIAREQNALQVVLVNGVPTCKAALSGADPACVPANIFQLGQLSPAAARYLSADGFQQGQTVEQIVSASVTGDLDPVGVRSPFSKEAASIALGAEYRSESLQMAVDTESASGDLAGAGGGTLPVSGSFRVAEGFGELRVPLVENVPFSELLQVEAGYRYSSYSSAGALSTYKIGAEWQPVDDMRFRATYQRAARAPNILELFTPQSLGGWSVGKHGDPCGTDELLTQEQCDRTNGGKHLAGYGTATLDCPDDTCFSLLGGSTDLKPEVGLTRSIGLVLTPKVAPGFSATVDYFDIKIAGLVGVLPQSIVIESCGLSGAPYFCNMVHRAPGSGILYGTAGYIDSLNRNTGSLQTDGIDFETNYKVDFSDWHFGHWGSMTFSLLGTWTRHFITEPVPAEALIGAGIAPPYFGDCAGLFGLICGVPLPAWRHKVRVTWVSPWDTTLSVQWRHSSATRFDVNTGNAILNAPCGGPCGDVTDDRIGAIDYFDLTVGWSLSANTEMRLGINNIFDRDPPIIDSTILGVPLENGNTVAENYDALGRTIFAAYSIKM